MKKIISILIVISVILSYTACADNNLIWEKTFDGDELNGTAPSGWTMTNMDRFNITADNEKGNFVEFVSDAEGKVVYNIAQDVALPETFVFETQFKLYTDAVYGVQLNLTDSSGNQGMCLNIASTGINCDQEQFFTSGIAAVRNVSLVNKPSINVWHTLKAVFDVTNQNFSVYINDLTTPIAEKIYFRKTKCTAISQLNITAGNGTSVGLRHIGFDNFKIYPYVDQTVHGDSDGDILAKYDFENDIPGSLPIGWSVPTGGPLEGSSIKVSEDLANKYIDFFTISGDTKDSVQCNLQKELEGELTLSFDIMIENNANKSIQFNTYSASGGHALCLLIKSDGNVNATANNFSGGTVSVPFNIGLAKEAWHNFTFIIDGQNHKYDLYINHKLVGENIAFRTTASGHKQIKLASGEMGQEGNRHFKFDNLIITQGHIEQESPESPEPVNEPNIYGYDIGQDFQKSELNSCPEEFKSAQVGFTSGGYFKTVEYENEMVGEFYAVSGAGGDRINIPLKKNYTKISSFEFDIMLKSGSDYGVQINLSDESSRQFLCMNFSTASFDVDQEESDPVNRKIVFGQGMSYDRWYNIKIVIDAETKLADIYLNGKKEIEGAKPRKKLADGIKQISIVAGGGTGDGIRNCYIDNVYFYEGIRPNVIESSVNTGDTDISVDADSITLVFDCNMNKVSGYIPVTLLKYPTMEKSEVLCNINDNVYEITFPSKLDYASKYVLSLNNMATSEYIIPAMPFEVEFTTQDNAADKPGSIYISNIINGQNFLSGNVITVKLNAEDADGIRNVALFSDGEIVDIKKIMPYEVSYKVKDGNQTIRAMLTDEFGTITESTSIIITGSDFAFDRALISQKDGKAISSTTVYNQSAKSRTVTLILCTYSTKGILLDIKLDEKTVEPGKSENLSVQALNMADNSVVVSYICEGTQYLAPLFSPETYKEAE